MPPWICITRSTTWLAMTAPDSLAIEEACRLSRPLEARHAAYSVSHLAPSISTCESAIIHWIAWQSAPLSGSVTAKTITKSASLPPVMKVFSPLITHWSPSRRARVRMLRASEPASGLGDREAGAALALDRGDQVAALLLLGADVEDVVGAAAEAERHERPPALHLQDRGHDRPEVHAAVLLGSVDPPETRLARLQPQVAQHLRVHALPAGALVAQHLRLQGHDLVADERPHGVADLPLLVRQGEVDHRTLQSNDFRIDFQNRAAGTSCQGGRQWARSATSAGRHRSSSRPGTVVDVAPVAGSSARHCALRLVTADPR